MKEKQRLDILLVERGLFSGRDKARAAIMAGEIITNGQKTDKAGTMIPVDAEIKLLGKKLPYVSRGGLKLAKAIEVFGLNLTGKIVIDIGASTGGFTDCALSNGAARVYAVDVGYGQLAWTLRQDERVVVMEKTNARYLSTNDIPEKADMITADVSFISLWKAAGAAIENFLKPQGEVVALIKPQFEAGRENVGKKGVVKDSKVHEEVIMTVLDGLAPLGLSAFGLTFSPITGPHGNIEYLLYAKKEPEEQKFGVTEINQVVEEAFVTHS